MLIAQISDLHLRACGTRMHDRIDTQRALADCVRHVNRLDPRPDLVLATGDLTDWARPEDYVLLRRMLDELAIPCYVIPGNHDDRAALRAAFGDLSYLPATGEFLQYTIESWPLRLIGLDTVLPGEVGGGFCDARRQWLAQRLEEQPQRPTVLFMHHPPFPSGIGFLDTPPFAGAAELVELVARHAQVRQVMCGHIHRAIYLNWAGTCAAVAPSTVYQMNLAFTSGSGFAPTIDPPAIALYRWSDGIGPTGYISLISTSSP
jgi:3',5'-cyclic-AMP phosphodiesterase